MDVPDNASPTGEPLVDHDHRHEEQKQQHGSNHAEFYRKSPVEPSPPPRAAHGLRRHRREDENSPRRRAGAGCRSSMSTVKGDESSTTSSRNRHGHHRQSSAGKNTGGSSHDRRARSSTAIDGTSTITFRRNPLARYVLLSGALVMSGVAARYLWRQLAGLVGGVLILAVARRTSTDKGDRDSAEQGQDGVGARPPPSSLVDRNSSTRGEAAGVVVQGHDRRAEEVEAREEATGDGTCKTAFGDSDGRSETAFGGAFAVSTPALREFWSDGGFDCPFQVRGLNYMVDRKKIPAGPAAMQLVHVDLFVVEEAVFHVASKGRCRDRIAAFSRSFEERGETAPFLFLVNILIPGTPIVSCVMYWALLDEDDLRAGSDGGKFLDMIGRYAQVPGSRYSRLDRRPQPLSSKSNAPSAEGSPAPSVTHENEVEDPPTGTGALAGDPGGTETSHRVGDSVAGSGSLSDGSGSLRNGSGSSMETSSAAGGAATQSSGDANLRVGGGEADAANEGPTDEGVLPGDDFRNERFKLIPSIVEGPFIVRKAVGNKPALLGHKLRQRYFRGPGYVETDVDVGSSMVAARIVSLCRGYARCLTVELGVCLEGRCEAELPEKCIGVARLINVDFEGAEPLDVSAAECPLAQGSCSAVDGDGRKDVAPAELSNMADSGCTDRSPVSSPAPAEPEQLRRAAATTSA